MRKQWYERTRAEVQLKKIQEGRVLSRSKKLFPLEGVVIDGSNCMDPEVCTSRIKERYCKKWGTNDVHVPSRS